MGRFFSDCFERFPFIRQKYKMHWKEHVYMNTFLRRNINILNKTIIEINMHVSVYGIYGKES